MSLAPAVLQELLGKVAVGDLAWVRARFDAGELDGLRDHLDSATWRELPRRLEADDVPWVRTAVGALQAPGAGVPMAVVVDPDAARDVRVHLADGDLSWLRSQYRAGQLDWLRERLSTDDWTELSRRLDAGDLPWVRRVVGGVRVPGYGLLGADTAGDAVTWTPPPARRPNDRRYPWLLPTGVAVTVLALLALLLSRCNSDDKPAAAPGTTAPALTIGTTVAPSTTVAATTTTARVTTTTVAPSTVAPGSADLVDTAAGTAAFSTLTRALAAADLTTTLKGAGPFTLFAPSDAAFAKLPAGTLENLLKDKAALAKVLSYHVVAGRIGVDQLVNGELKTLEGDPLTIAFTNGRVTVNTATLTTPDVPATNGAIYVVDSVLLPPGFTVPGAATTPAQGDLVEITTADGRFATLTRALATAGLSDTLHGAGPFTLLAPTDAAFKALGDDVLAKLLADRATLTKVLTYHVLAGRVASTDIKAGATKTVNGATVQFAVANGAITVNGARVVTPDVAATNGVVHVIDKVLVPADVDLTKLAATPTTSTSSTLAPPTTVAPTTTSTSPATTVPAGALAWVVYFNSDSSTIRSDAAAVIRDAARQIPDGATVSLVGVADTRGDAAANLKLSEDRAKAVKAAFEAAGVKATFVISAKGAEPNGDLQKARRVEISVR